MLLSQLAIYYQWQRNPCSTQYNLPFFYQFSLSYTVESLKQAVLDIADVHPQLYMRYRLDGKSEVCQYIDRDSLFIDIIFTTEDEISELKSSFVKPFDLLNESVARFKIIKTQKYVYFFHDIHHISFDGTSHVSFKKELESALTGGKLLGEEVDMAELVSYEQSMRESSALSDDMDYFRRVLSKASVLSLFPKKNAKALTGQFDKYRIDNKEILGFCQKHKVTPNSLFITALSIVISRFTQEESVLFGVVNHGRKKKDYYSNIGMFVRTMPLVLSVNNSKNIIDQIKENALLQKELWGHQTASLSEIINQFKIAFPLVFIYQKEIKESFPLALSSERPQVDSIEELSIEVYEESDSFEIRVSYPKECYDQDLIRVFINAYIICLNSIVSSAQSNCSQIAILSDVERKLLLDMAYGGELKYDQSKTFLDALSRNTALTPDKIAVIAENGGFTYELLDARSNLLASTLIDLGVLQNSFVAIMLPRINEFVISTIAVFKSGGAYLPLDVEAPGDRLLYMLKDSHAKVLITTREIFQQKQIEGGFNLDNILFVDEFDFDRQVGYINNSLPESIAYMIYTSGSTGTPKGVMILHKSLWAYLNAWTGEVFQVRDSDRISCYPSFSFDASINDLYGSLYAGATLYITPSSLKQDITGLASFLTANQITGGSYPAQLGMELLNSMDLPLRYICLGGEKVKPVKKSNIIIVNQYGPTEFTVSSCSHTVNQQIDNDNIPIGSPLKNTWSYILDADNRLVPRGVCGELCLSGIQVAKGYWNQETLTAEKFVDNPYSTCEGNSMMYRTGDLARWNSDGELECFGRIDNQVKLRGFRIELGEIESQLSKFAGITLAVVVLKSIGHSEQLCAYYTSDSKVDEAVLIEYLSAALTDYMVPTIYVQLDNMPLLISGKVDFSALPMPEIKSSEVVAPRTQMEGLCLNIVRELLGVTTFGISCNLFAWGLDSMGGIKLSVLLTDKLGLNISYADIFRYQTVEELAAFISGDAHSDCSQQMISDIMNYDYTAINTILSSNTISAFENISVEIDNKESDLGNLLLTGTTKYWGIHLLYTLLTEYKGVVYCLVPSSEDSSAQQWLQQLLFYYFDRNFDELIGSRLIVIEGDITDQGSIMNLDLPITYVLNCDTNNSHFVSGDDLIKTNIRGVEHLIAYCKSKDKTLIHLSTRSVSGFFTVEQLEFQHPFTESDLYIGQIHNNEYTYSKFIAERLILESIARGEVRAKIMREGNMMPRSSDGEFQIDASSNSFVKRLKAFKLLKAVSISMLAIQTELSPMDEMSSALLKLISTPDEFTVFNVCNTHFVPMGDLIYAMRDYGFTIDIISDADFESRLKEAMKCTKNLPHLSGILAYQSYDNKTALLHEAEMDMSFTTTVNYCLENRWSSISKDYLYQMIEKLDGLGFFDED